MPDAIFADRRLASIYDFLEGERDDLEAYVAIIDQFDARTVVDVGCGTGTFACMLAQRGIDVVGVDPAAASIDVARSKPHAGDVRWIVGTARALPPVQADLATMTGNVAQVFVTDDEWTSTLLAIRAALRPDGRLVFETRDPTRRAWLGWNRAETYERIDVPHVGPVTSWCDLVSAAAELVTFRWTFEFEADGAVIVSESTLRFRERGDVERSLERAGFAVEEVRDAPDRPGREFVFIARAT